MTDGRRYRYIIVIGSSRLLECCFEVVANVDQIIIIIGLCMIYSWFVCFGGEYQEEGHCYNEEEEEHGARLDSCDLSSEQ